MVYSASDRASQSVVGDRRSAGPIEAQINAQADYQNFLSHFVLASTAFNLRIPRKCVRFPGHCLLRALLQLGEAQS
jgi:hypothetical protein